MSKNGITFHELRALLLEFPGTKYQRALLAVTDLVTERDH